MGRRQRRRWSGAVASREADSDVVQQRAANRTRTSVPTQRVPQPDAARPNVPGPRSQRAPDQNLVSEPTYEAEERATADHTHRCRHLRRQVLDDIPVIPRLHEEAYMRQYASLSSQL